MSQNYGVTEIDYMEKKFKVGDRVKSLNTGQSGTIARLDDCWGRDWVIRADELFRGTGGMMSDGFAALEKDLVAI